MKMKEDENIAKYVKRIKASVSAFRASGRKIEDTIVVRKVLIILLLIYAIRVSTIQEMRCDPKNDITLDALVGRLTTFQLDNFDNNVPSSSNLESTFQAKLSLEKKATKSKRKKSKNEDEDGSDDDLEVIDELISIRFPKCKGKYKGKIPFIFLSCKELGHITTRYPKK